MTSIIAFRERHSCAEKVLRLCLLTPKPLRLTSVSQFSSLSFGAVSLQPVHNVAALQPEDRIKKARLEKEGPLVNFDPPSFGDEDSCGICVAR